MRRAGQKVYDSRQWRRVRKAYLQSKHYICERCGQPASIVHHKTYLTEENAADAETAFSFENLEALCQACHNNEHGHFQELGAVFTASGDVAGVRATKEQREFLAARAAIESGQF